MRTLARRAVVSGLFLAATAFLQAQEPSIGKGAIRGTVWDADSGMPLGRVRVSVVQARAVTSTSPDGAFLFEGLPAGEYTLTFSTPGYDREVIDGIVVLPGQLQDVQATLHIEIVEMNELVVTGTDLVSGTEAALLDIRQQAVVVQDAISKDLIGKAGATDVAGALPLVVGASVTQGKYATVRGLSDRYTGTTLNGVRIPSADPRRRAVQVDLFPTGTVESVTVTKTFTPDLHGDFTGGVVNIETKSIPDEPLFSASISTEHNSLATGESAFLTYDGGSVFGSARDLPRDGLIQPSLSLSSASSWIKVNPTPQGITAANEWDRLTRAFAPVMGVSEDAPSLNHSLSLTGGRTWTLGSDDRFGVLTALSYKRAHDFYGDALNNSVQYQSVDSGPLLIRRLDARGLDELLVGALLDLAWQPSEAHELAITTVYNQAREDVGRLQEQFRIAEIEQNQTLQYTEREVLSPQLHGRHAFAGILPGTAFSDVEIDWYAAANVTSQDEPDVRFFRNYYEPATRSYYFSVGSVPNTSRTRRIFRGLEEDSDQLSADVTLPFVQWTKAEGRIRTGFYLERAERTYQQRSYSYNNSLPQVGPLSNAARQCNFLVIQPNGQAEFPGQLWTEFFLDPDRIGLAPRVPDCSLNQPPAVSTAAMTPAPNQLLWVLEPLNDDVNYTGEQEIEAGYAMAELPLGSRLELVFGARLERTSMSVVPSNVLNQVETIVSLADGTFGIDFDSDPAEATADIAEDSWLPSVGMTYELMRGMKLRGSGTRTIARPTFRELAPVATAEFIDGDEFMGNTDLRLAEIRNYDLRWEWFRDDGDVFAASLFYKELEDPIEYVSFTATGRPFVQPRNFDEGELRGFELEARVALDRFGARVRGLAVGVNYTKLESEVIVPQELQDTLVDFGLAESGRPLQGQPAELSNLNVTYDNTDHGWSAGLFYNRVGETLVSGSARGDDGAIPNVLDKPLERVDLTVTKSGLRNWAFTLKLKNLTTPDRETVYRTPNGEETIKFSSSTPLLVSLGAGWSW